MSVTAASGFVANGCASGIKDGGALDLALVAAARAVPAAGVFTTNGAAAAPVQVSRGHLASTGGMARAVVLNSGGANAATGAEGVDAANRTCEAVAGELGTSREEILVCSTGLIGVRLPVERILAHTDTLVAGAGSGRPDAARAANAILTTDTHAKEVTVDGGGFTVGGMAKGAGMIAPNMATMLAVLTTDAAASPALLQDVLRAGVADSFNSLIVDGCMSTNDTVVLLASGDAGAVDERALRAAVESACGALALELARDAEGTTRVAAIRVIGAASVDDARRAGRMVALSLLVKTSLYGADPYWGRVVSELGSSGSAFDLDSVSIDYGGVRVCEHGVEIPHDRDAVATHMRGDHVEITCDLGIGTGEAVILTTDLGHGYIDENMRTS